ATRKEQFARHEILRRQAVCGRRLRMTSFLLKGAAPPSPLHCEREHSFLLIICAYCYMLIFNIRLSAVRIMLRKTVFLPYYIYVGKTKRGSFSCPKFPQKY
ncbi:MAG: hypothetical protein IJB43_00905, partial [Clostridia bacterium]|nr:hypothetical protein [Clostridia bacterium]